MASPCITPERYSQEFFNAFRAARDKGSFIITCNTVREAKRYRSRLYAFRKCLQTNPELFVEDTLLASVVQMRISGTDLILYVEEPSDAAALSSLPTVPSKD